MMMSRPVLLQRGLGRRLPVAGTHVARSYVYPVWDQYGTSSDQAQKMSTRIPLLPLTLGDVSHHHQQQQCCQLSTSTSTVATTEATTDSIVDDSKRVPPRRPWLDPSLTWDTRVVKFTESPVGTLNPHAVAFDALSLVDQSCRQGNIYGMKMAHEVLDRCLAEKDFRETTIVDTADTSTQEEHSASITTDASIQNVHVYPVPLKMFQTILYGWATLAKHQTKAAMTRMRQTLDQLLFTVRQEQERFGSQQHTTTAQNSSYYQQVALRPTTDIYNTYLSGLNFASRHNSEAAKMAEELLHEMTQYHSQFGWHTKPNTRSYTLALCARVHSPFDVKSAGRHAERILRKLQRAHQQERKRYQQHYGHEYDTQHPSNNKLQIPTPDVVVYDYVIQAYGKDPSQRSTQKARDLFIEAINTVQPDWGLVTSVIAAYSRLAANPHVDRSIRWQAAEQAEEILETARQDMAQIVMGESNTASSRPVKSRNKKPANNRVAPWNACMNAYGRSGSIDGALKAESMLQKLLTDHIEGMGLAAPDTISFNTVLQAWSSQRTPDASQKAQDLLNLQRQLFADEVIDENAMPDMAGFTIVMNAWARSTTEPQKVQKTQQLLQELLIGLENDTVAAGGNNPTVAFSAVLSAAAHPVVRKTKTQQNEPIIDPFGTTDSSTSGNDAASDDDSYAIALRTYRELKEDVYHVGCQPDHFVFASMLHAAGAHTHPSSTERRQMVQVVFEDACLAGHVSKLVVKALYKECPDKALLAEILERCPEFVERMPTRVDDLPKEWTQKVPFAYRIIGRPATGSQARRKGSISR
ncbi:Pentatricopeptide repeat-containing protein [Seminavis robusta]|uniref:Pentatricopeptide repeat-containing protein n=1 Tax=Seminavis robusta TaxID=568900 RepID=A0A9N8HF71_9STRA|nr:Pentatricopeptide repeat-containing protein [Seminavis robusta]|eukprot:Sro554_g165470.1 Pentatricopeptide repeat-containing protein (808) ;mRNA; r:13066-15740